MTDPRNPLITGVTNVAGYRGDDKLPTSYAVNQLFSGEPLGQNVSANNIIKSGTYRFNTTTSNLPSHLVGTSGLLTVMHERPSAPSNANYGSTAANTDYNPSVIRQVAWPDGPNDVTPYTRTKQNGTWGEWQTMGGNLRRVNLNENVIVGNEGLLGEVAQTNVMYYSFGSYTLTLPDPSSYPLATRIGLEQWSGQGSVVSADGNTTQATSPAYETNENGEPTNVNLGPQVYTFEIVADSNGAHTWVMDIDNNIAKTIQGIHNRISTNALISTNNDREMSELIGNGFSAPYRAWKNGNTIVYTKSSLPVAGDNYYTDRDATTAGGAISEVIRNSSTQVVESIKIGNTVYTRYSSSDNSSNTITAKVTEEANTRELADTTLSNRLGAGVTEDNTATSQLTTLSNRLGAKITTTDTVSALLGDNVTNSSTGVLGSSGTVTAQFKKVNALFGTGVNEVSHENLIGNLGSKGTATNQLTLIKNLFGDKITILTTGNLGSSGTVSAQLKNAKDLFGTGITTAVYNANTTSLGSAGTATAQFTLVKNLLGDGVTTSTTNEALGTAGTVTKQFLLTKTLFGSGVSNSSTVALGSSGTVTAQLSLTKNLLGTGVTVSDYNASTTSLGSAGTATAQFTLVKNLLGLDTTDRSVTLSTTNTVTKVLADLNDKIGTTDVAGEGAAISSSNGKTVTELIGNKEPRSIIYVCSSDIGVDTSFRDANSVSYPFKDLLHRIHPIIVVSSSITITLPSAANYSVGTKCKIEVLAGKSVTVVDGGVANNSESFSNAAGNPILVLPFEVSHNGNGNIWTLLVIA